MQATGVRFSFVVCNHTNFKFKFLVYDQKNKRFSFFFKEKIVRIKEEEHTDESGGGATARGVEGGREEESESAISDQAI